MEKTEPFYDFCIPYNRNETKLREIIEELITLGYKTIAIEQIFEQPEKAEKRSIDIPDPYDISKLQKQYGNKIRILQRLTIIYDNTALQHALACSLKVKKYHVIAAQPKTEILLTHCCANFDGDIITFDAEIGGNLLIARKSYKVAVSRNIYFEIKYSPIITNTNYRKNAVKLVNNYNIRGKAKNIIFSSGAKDPFELRGPYDVANLAFIFSLPVNQGKNAINKCCRSLFLRAESRRIGKTIMYIKSKGPVILSDSSDNDSEDESDSEQEEEVRVLAKCKKEKHNIETDNSDCSNSASEKQPAKRKKIYKPS